MTFEEQLRTCARVARQGRQVAFIVPRAPDERGARDRCTALTPADAAKRGALIYGTGLVRFVQASGASFVLAGFSGFVVLDARLEVSAGMMRELGDLKDACAMLFPEGEFERLAQAENVTDAHGTHSQNDIKAVTP
ncbi:hypothetical protein [Pacificibacter marinus]|uniref:Uncharacterized protein n=1 Tax=Pacificibacter marinus TaxID=658057 RepID=A0A1Y5TSV3_9RHOB|nr:hypothetical protein [Pacificibacter marinus]SEL41122.1 hypothetical protein SAMN04488032_1272 [Pacificibacter marinus]SLN71670.1 hypothetical protein PAM7971_03836 [Pacificibacter marinus]